MRQVAPARRCTVAPEDLSLAGAPPDHADAFCGPVRSAPHRSPEDRARRAVERTPAALLAIVRTVQHGVLRLQLGPRSSAEHVLGWRVRASEPDQLLLEATGPLLSGLLVVRVAAGELVVTTLLVHHRRSVARPLWAVVEPAHRVAARFLVARLAEVGGSRDPGPAGPTTG